MSDWTEPARSATGDCGCDKALDELWAYLDAELDQLEAAQVRAHLESCRGCLEEHDVEVVVKKLVRRCYAQDEAAPVDLRAKIHAQLVTLRVRVEG
ncbi:mycothiol system anti-sigma-R factor [Cellulomonas sp. HZM]|uniref:mycothiol system anti-sigma-R factor n=1 Tax=Cellulomonas sp. HZM TaxID=1454010 RepID=UPI000557C7B7|nr:mycothiol system anti-sigma-R factor [Cellulomonas sp. HZM]